MLGVLVSAPKVGHRSGSRKQQQQPATVESAYRYGVYIHQIIVGDVRHSFASSFNMLHYGQCHQERVKNVFYPTR